MILYNYRYRGPFEYDKFVLNVYQLRNEIKRASKKFKEEETNSLIERREELDRIIDNLLSRLEILSISKWLEEEEYA